MLPAVQFDTGEVVTDSDKILAALEARHGPLAGIRLADPALAPLRRLERALFSAWCGWLCRPESSQARHRYLVKYILSFPSNVQDCTAGDGGPGGDGLAFHPRFLLPLHLLCNRLHLHTLPREDGGQPLLL